MTAKDIQKALNNYYADARYAVSNVYLFGNMYGETDFLVVKNPKGLIYDIEVKISRGDFFADFKKEVKHQILSTGTRSLKHDTYTLGGEDGQQRLFVTAGQPIECNDRPNRFYFAVPENLVKPHEVPEYAGLLYVNDIGVVNKVKEAKLLHKEIHNVEAKLCNKFYYAYRDLAFFKDENGVNKLRNTISRYEKEIEQMQKQNTENSNRAFMLESHFTQLLDHVPFVWSQPINIEQRVDGIPGRRDSMNENTLYLDAKLEWAAFRCFCGCGVYETLPLKSGYKIHEEKTGLSITPLISSWRCTSKYIIKDNTVKFIIHGKRK